MKIERICYWILLSIVIAGMRGASHAALPAADASTVPNIQEPAIYMSAVNPIDARVNDLIRRMSLKEKVGQLQNGAPAIPRLGIPAYNYWSEALHGLARAGVATVFPQATGMAATWDDGLIRRMGDVVSTEARATYNADAGKDAHPSNHGLTLWSPNINIFRDPRWGRGQETYGEDPWLTSRMGVAYILGLQGDDPKYYKAIACAKHFAVHSGPESTRHMADVRPPERDLYETYLPQFEAAVREGKVGQVMSAYNALYGVPAPANSFLLTDLLRKQWGFNGYVVSDCDAVADILRGHHYTADIDHAVVAALEAGNDLNCGRAFQALVSAVGKGLVTEGEIDTSLRRVFTARFRLGMFDPPDFAYAKIPATDKDTPEHAALALQVAREAIVLLKNSGVLPLDKTKLRKVAVVGFDANDVRTLEGNYNGKPSHPVTILQGIQNALGAGATVTYDKGCPLAIKQNETFGTGSPDLLKAVQDASQADVVIYVGGLNSSLEGEEMNVSYDGFQGGDRTAIELPAPQETLLKALAATGKPVVYINCSGGAVAMPWEAENIPAILQAWYPGQSGGTAVADVLFGNYNPAGRLPVTFYGSTQDLPPFVDYSMANRTYRYFRGKPLFAFGHGLSYTQFKYETVKLAGTAERSGTIQLSLDVQNTGSMDGDEVVQVYVRHLQSKWAQPIHSLVAFKRVHIAKGETAPVELQFAAQQLRFWDTDKKTYVVEPGAYEVQVGAASDDIRQTARITVSGGAS